MSDDNTSPTEIKPWLAASRAEVTSRAESWLSSAPLAQLIAGLGGPDPSQVDARALLDWSTRTLDTRRGAERHDTLAAGWDTRWVELVLQLAPSLGLIETPLPSLQIYDIALVLGGTTTGNRLRAEFAAQLAHSGITAAELVGLSAMRSLSPNELTNEPDSANDQNEWQNLLRNLRTQFGAFQSLSASSDEEGTLTWREETLTNTQTGQRLRLIVAPSSTTQRRATTSDAVRFFLQRTPPADRASTLIITSSIYAPYQFLRVAPILLDAGVEHVELVGTPTKQDASALLAQRLGQEIHAAVEAASELLPAEQAT